jgi:hypothetical protein
MTVRGEQIVLRDVPQGACPRCGAQVYKRDVIVALEALKREMWAIEPSCTANDAGGQV